MTEAEHQIPEPYQSAHKQSSMHREKVLASEWLGCFYCLMIFKPKSIREWWDDEQTAICPVCGIDAVLPLTPDQMYGDDFLLEMHRHWFGPVSHAVQVTTKIQ